MKKIKTEPISKPWGCEEIWAQTDKYVGKFLRIGPGEKLSLQYHVKKDETLHCLSGYPTVQIGVFISNAKNYPGYDEDGRVVTLKPGDTIHIKPGIVHRISNEYGIEQVVIVEASTAELDDIVRLEDKYGRLE